MELFNDPVLAEEKERTIAVINNRFADKQFPNAPTVHKNRLSKKDFDQLLNSTACDVNKPGGHLNRHLLVVGVCFKRAID